ncbi:GDSL-type esterase/lipase family protein [Tellurirhabdus rosea]|uniref:GDSL-type esterase/lipase family protein n=1 Tax=Tellurirhabdus rosea TaxID=2674997 RepID=UPI002251F7E8|nr:GDSL-type esterase/lipase family protein [Tellurirhabdus rosea]
MPFSPFTTLVATLAFCGLTGLAAAQSAVPDTSFRSTYYEQKRTLYESLPVERNSILFIGDSITDTAEWAELLGNSRIKNRGISGDLSFGVLARLDALIAAKPEKVFLMIGVNDLARGVADSVIIRNYRQMAERFRRQSPQTRIYWQSVLSTNDSFPQFKRHQGKMQNIRALNDALRTLASQTGQTFVDLHPYLSDSDGKLDARYTNDGLHLNGTGYSRWVEALRKNKYL